MLASALNGVLFLYLSEWSFLLQIYHSSALPADQTNSYLVLQVLMLNVRNVYHSTVDSKSH